MSENPSYLTVVEMPNGFHVDRMDWNDHKQEYEMGKTTFPMSSREQADVWAKAQAERTGLEIR